MHSPLGTESAVDGQIVLDKYHECGNTFIMFICIRVSYSYRNELSTFFACYLMRDILQRAPVRMLTPATRISGIVLRVRHPIQVVTINGGARTVDSSSCSSSR